jgi:hypothetical protein
MKRFLLASLISLTCQSIAMAVTTHSYTSDIKLKDIYKFNSRYYTSLISRAVFVEYTHFDKNTKFEKDGISCSFIINAGNLSYHPLRGGEMRPRTSRAIEQVLQSLTNGKLETSIIFIKDGTTNTNEAIYGIVCKSKEELTVGDFAKVMNNQVQIDYINIEGRPEAVTQEEKSKEEPPMPIY